MPKITGSPTLAGMQLYASVSAGYGNLDLGQRIKGSNGTEFIYVKAGELLVVGNLAQSAAYTTNHNALSVAAQASGSYQVTVTLANAAVTANYYKDGFLNVDTTPGLGESYTIAGHAAQTSATGDVIIYLKEPLRTSFTTSTKVSLRKNACDGVIQNPATTATGTVVGAVIYPIASGEYGFLQTKGVGTGLSDSSSIIMGSALASNSGTAGCVTLHTAGFPIVGRAMQAASNGHQIPVYWDM